MKTLDEVIDDLELLRVTTQSESEYELVISVLHYMKEYKRVQNKIEKIALGNIEDTLDKIDNPALTWDELKGMEGNPIWIDAESLSVGVSPYWKDWYIIKSFSNDEFMYCNDGYEWAKEMQGRMWQAYRKERS